VDNTPVNRHLNLTVQVKKLSQVIMDEMYKFHSRVL